MLLIFWVTYIYYLHIACHLQIMFYFFLFNLFFHYFLCFNALDNTFSKILNKSGGSRDPCLISDLRGKAFNISSTRDLLYIKKNYLFIWLPRVLVAAHGIFTVSLGMFHCSADSLVAVPGFQQVGFSICGTWS